MSTTHPDIDRRHGTSGDTIARYSPIIKAEVRRRVRPNARYDPVDVEQESMLDVVRRPPPEEVMGCPRRLTRYLKLIAAGKAADSYRYHHRERRDINRDWSMDIEPNAQKHGQIPLELAHPGPGPEEIAMAREMEAALNETDSLGRQVLFLRTQGYTIVATATQVGCNERTVRRRLTKARRLVEVNTPDIDASAGDSLVEVCDGDIELEPLQSAND